MYNNTDYAQSSSSIELADFGTRALAYIIDSLIVGVVLWLIALVFRGSSNLVVSFALHAMYQVYFLTQKDGQTLGKRFMGIRVIKQNRDPLTVGDAFVRYIGYYLDTLGLMLGWLWAIWDNDHQGWHDKLASTVVIRA